MLSVHLPPEGRHDPPILPEKGCIPSPTKSFPPPPLARPRRSAVPDPACARTSHLLLSFETTSGGSSWLIPHLAALHPAAISRPWNSPDRKSTRLNSSH